MPGYEEFYKARNTLSELISKDLLGPVTDDEILIEMPTQYYVMGKLYPNYEELGGTETNFEDITTNSGIEQNTDAYDSALATSNMKNPSTMGLTFTLKPGIDTFSISVMYAMYSNFSKEEIEKTEYDIRKFEEDIDEKTVFWIRDGKKKQIMVSAHKNSVEEIENQIYVKVYVHKTFKTGETVITVVLTNERKLNGYDPVETNRNTVFQPELKITSKEMEGKVFTSVRRQIEVSDDVELAELDMLYAQNKCFGQGHGCAVDWDVNTTEPDYIKSTFMPHYNLLQMKAAQIQGTPIFNMKYLFEAEANDVIKELYLFIEKYDCWIQNLENLADSGNYVYEDSARYNITKCISIAKRIRNAIDELKNSSEKNGDVWKAFRYANEAMYMQRAQSLIKAGKTVNDEDINWYPFQLAFVLLEIISFTKPESEDRNMVDLLWFPTGGGKTEAYLGIAAFAIFYRRLSKQSGMDGVTVLMRYTLRLLTIQQFERASILITACEIMRKRYNLLGGEISIGLWVGNKLTPGTLDEADRTLSKLHAGGDVGADEANPCQIKRCPWCGEKLYNRNYSVDVTKKRMIIKCDTVNCECNKLGSLPIRLIDEEIYEHRPTFIVATVDKFAQITLQDKPSALFSVDGRNLPPELIIQDELHLISGPLGTMTGIYEAAITKICERNGIPVKIVASTATIRNADKQIRALYGRDFSQFPAQGITADDSFFAVKSSEEERPARLYIGCMGVGATFTTTLIRVYASWLYASRYLADLGYDEKVIDNSWTLTGYFNSLRELGGTQTQVVDDIQSRYQYLKNKKFADLQPSFTGEEKYEYSVELTSRMTNDEISDVIQTKLKVPYKHNDHKDTYDFVLASNMISVGVDVGRLGTMVVAGQPKTNAEYIQATSRVGRDNPGLVFMVYNASRSRDRSHYEQFLRYHAAMYRYVEATSLTPFSDRARDRGLQALFVTLCRYMCPELLANDAAGNFNANSEEVKKIENIIFNYVKIVDERELDNVIKEVKDVEKKWMDETTGELWYHKLKKKSLLKPDTEENDRFRCMNSMRSVEKQSGLYLLGD